MDLPGPWTAGRRARAPSLREEHLAALARAVEAGPRPNFDEGCAGGSPTWAAWLREEFGISVSETKVSRALPRLGFPGVDGAAAGARPGTLKRWRRPKNFPAGVAEIRERHAGGKRIEVWFQE